MADFPFGAIGFDLDGTLLDTHQDLGAAVNHALALGGFAPVPVTEVEGMIGGGAKVMLAHAIQQQGGAAESEVRRLYKALLAHYGDQNAVHTRPYPGVEKVLDELAAHGVRMAVVTNKFESFARDILTALGLADRFAAIIGGDTLGKGRAKPEPDPVFAAMEACGGQRFAFVGDSSYDIRAARAAGVPVIAASYGYCDLPPHELGADAVIGSFAELIPALERL